MERENVREKGRLTYTCVAKEQDRYGGDIAG